MERRILLPNIVILLVCASLFSCQKKVNDLSVVQSGAYKQSLKDIYPKLAVCCLTNAIPGMAVAVSIDNQIVLADGFGYSNVELKVKASPSHKYRIGQISELITALTAAKLSEQGKLPLDKPVSELLPGISKNPANYTAYQLGTHSAGIRVDNTPAGNGNFKNIAELMPTFIDDDLIFEPGSGFAHTELGIDLLGYLIEKSNNAPFTEVVQNLVLDQLKLTNTFPEVPYRITDGKADTYNYDYLAQPELSGQANFRGKEASAGYLSSVIDLIKIGNALLYPGFLKQETINLITIPQKLKSGQLSQYGLGLIVGKDSKGRTFFGQRGAVQGGCSALLIYPEEKMVIAIAVNIGNISFDLPIFEVAESFMNQLHPEEKPNVPETK
jgi:serine beta-lactamase-like protein LACTB, mitochondrial